MKSCTPNETPDSHPFHLASQAECVLAAIDQNHPARNALWSVLAASNGRLLDILLAVNAADAAPTWENLVEPLEAASMDLFHALALFEAVHDDEDDPAMEAVGTLLRMAKVSVDEMTNAMIAKVPKDSESASISEQEQSALTSQDVAIQMQSGPRTRKAVAA